MTPPARQRSPAHPKKEVMRAGIVRSRSASGMTTMKFFAPA